MQAVANTTPQGVPVTASEMSQEELRIFTDKEDKHKHFLEFLKVGEAPRCEKSSD